jgi:hypothetical protein
VNPNIPLRTNRDPDLWAFDPISYKQRNRVERLFAEAKQFGPWGDDAAVLRGAAGECDDRGVDPAKNVSAPDAALRLTPRSTAQALIFLANGVEVPTEHVTCGLVRMPIDGIDPTEATRGVFRIHSCPGHPHKQPACAYVAVWYRDHWFYIDDHESKATLMLMLQLRRLDFQKQRIENIPTLTLPVGR